MRDGSTYRANRHRAAKPHNNLRLKAERKARGMTRRELDYERWAIRFAAGKEYHVR